MNFLKKNSDLTHLHQKEIMFKLNFMLMEMIILSLSKNVYKMPKVIFLLLTGG
jgi:hypothetical protein